MAASREPGPGPGEGSRASPPAVFGRAYRLGRIFGFEVALDASWIFIAVLVTWSLARGYFPGRYDELSAGAYWAMGLAGAIGLFVSVVLHELSHSLVARRHGVEMRGITLFIFGGVAHMGDEPPDPNVEFRIAIAGPVASIVIAGTFYLLARLTAGLAAPLAVTGVLAYLGLINGVLAGFNLVPAFPLDGGRVLRAALWHYKDDLRSATNIASRVGGGFGAALIALGVLSLLGGQFVAGLWWGLIGMFLRSAARMSYQQVLMREVLEGEPVSRFMHDHPITVPAETSLASLVEDYFYRQYHKMYPVVDRGRVIGNVGIQQVKEIPREEWTSRAVGEVAREISESNTIDADTDAVKALSRMRRHGVSRLMVMRDGQLVGIITLKDLLQFLAVKIELEE